MSTGNLKVFVPWSVWSGLECGRYSAKTAPIAFSGSCPRWGDKHPMPMTQQLAYTWTWTGKTKAFIRFRTYTGQRDGEHWRTSKWWSWDANVFYGAVWLELLKCAINQCESIWRTVIARPAKFHSTCFHKHPFPYRKSDYSKTSLHKVHRPT